MKYIKIPYQYDYGMKNSYPPIIIDEDGKSDLIAERDREIVDRINEKVSTFSCPLNKSNRFALCNGCSFKLSGNCKEWKKKKWNYACGCGKWFNCVCGFYYRSCGGLLTSLPLSPCLYCGRNI